MEEGAGATGGGGRWAASGGRRERSRMEREEGEWEAYLSVGQWEVAGKGGNMKSEILLVRWNILNYGE